MKFVEKNHLTSLKLSKFTPSTAQQSAALSDERLKSYGQKTVIFGHFWSKWPFWPKISVFWLPILAADCCAVLRVNLDNFRDVK